MPTSLPFHVLWCVLRVVGLKRKRKQRNKDYLCSSKVFVCSLLQLRFLPWQSWINISLLLLKCVCTRHVVYIVFFGISWYIRQKSSLSLPFPDATHNTTEVFIYAYACALKDKTELWVGGIFFECWWQNICWDKQIKGFVPQINDIKWRFGDWDKLNPQQKLRRKKNLKDKTQNNWQESNNDGEINLEAFEV